MNPLVKYTFGRVGLFVVVAAPLFLLPVPLNGFIKLMIALVVSMAASFVLLRPWRNELAEWMAAKAQRRNADKERLRAALAGEDEEERGARPTSTTDRNGRGDSGGER